MFSPLLVLTRNEIGTEPAPLPIFNAKYRLGEGLVVVVDRL